MTTKILVLASNPEDTAKLRLDKEIREIKKILERAQRREKFAVEPILAAQIEDLQESIIKEKPRIVHFCGHGAGSEGLILEAESGKYQLVNNQALGGLFKLFETQVECVMLNACYSKVQALEINQHINYVIGTKKQIQDRAAIAFTKGFYTALFNGEMIERAYEFGRNRIQLDIYGSENRERKLVPVYLEERGDLVELPQHEVLVLLKKETLNQIKLEPETLFSRPPSPKHLSRQEYRNRQALLNKVNQFWVKGVLESSLYNQVLIELGLEERPEALAQPWRMVLQTSDEESKPLPEGTKVIDLFDDMGEGRTMLILGESGSGKTTTLLELARDLTARAKQNVDHLIPVVFNLSSWALKKQKIENWLVEELNNKYQVPLKMGQTLVKEDKLLLLLDGLDEVKAEYREKCIADLNQFNQDYCPEIVVCSRIKDYEILSNRLNFQRSVFLRLLTLEQIRNYLNSLGSDVTGLRALLEQDKVLQELAQSPLILNIMTLTYQGVAIEDLPKTNVMEERRKKLFDDYIDKMFRRRGASQRYSKLPVKHWLIWLAQKMLQESQTVFLIEKMQPTWLQTSLQKMVYVLGIATNLLLVFGFLTFLTEPILFKYGINNEYIASFETLTVTYILYSSIMLWNLIFKKPSSSSQKGNFILNKLFPKRNFVTRIFARMKNIFSLYYKAILRNFLVPEIKPVESVKWSFIDLVKTFQDILISVAFSGVIFIILLLLSYTLFILNSISTSNLNLIILSLLLLSKLILSLLTIVLSLFVVFFAIPVFLLSPFLLLLGGISVKTEPEKTTVPNQGVWKSIKNTMVFSFLGAIVGTIGAIILQFVLYPNSPDKLLALLIYFVPYYALWVGCLSLGACHKHLILRSILCFKGYIPWNYARFLDYAAERIFLRKVGGGYIFIHRMLMEHFAQM